MEAKCNYCEIFGYKPHCGRCKIFNAARERAPQEIDSLEELCKAIDDGTALEKYFIGDYKDIELYTGEVVRLYILGCNHDDIAGSNKKAMFTMGIFEVDGYYKANNNNTNKGGYVNSKMKTQIDRYVKLLPPIIQKYIVPAAKTTSAGDCSSEIVTHTELAFAFSEVEVFGTNNYSHQGEGHQYEFFEERMNIALLCNRYKWLRSPNYYYSGYFCYVHNTGFASVSAASHANGLAFCFCLSSKI